jgi:hypothetical protein
MTIAKTVLNAQQNDSNLIMDYCDEHGVYFYKDGERIEDK